MTGRTEVDLKLRPAELKDTGARDWVVRFAFGAGVSALAGLVSALAGPRVGGLFLAFPAILLASLTIVAKDDGMRQARDDARGAGIGTLGLIAFALALAVTATRWPLWLALLTAVAAWAAVGIGGYGIARLLGYGADEPHNP